MLVKYDSMLVTFKCLQPEARKDTLCEVQRIYKDVLSDRKRLSCRVCQSRDRRYQKGSIY